MSSRAAQTARDLPPTVGSHLEQKRLRMRGPSASARVGMTRCSSAFPGLLVPKLYLGTKRDPMRGLEGVWRWRFTVGRRSSANGAIHFSLGQRPRELEHLNKPSAESAIQHAGNRSIPRCLVLKVM